MGPLAPIPGGYGATDPEKSLQEARSFLYGFDAATIQIFFEMPCTIAAGGPARAARLGPRPQSPAAMVQRIPRNLRTISSDLDPTSKLEKMI